MMTTWRGKPLDECSREELISIIELLGKEMRGPAPEPPHFPTMLRKMWSGGEVQKWIDDNWPKEKT